MNLEKKIENRMEKKETKNTEDLNWLKKKVTRFKKYKREATLQLR